MAHVDILVIAKEVSNNASSNKEIAKMFNDFCEKYGKDTAKEIVKKSKELFTIKANGLNDRLKDCKDKIDNNALKYAWNGLRKDNDPTIKKFFSLASCKYGNAADFLKDWYPNTLNGIPAYKRNGVWTAYEINANNALRLLKTCFNTLCKAGKTNFRGKGLAKDHAND